MNIKFEYDRGRWIKDELSNNSVARVYSVYYDELGYDTRSRICHLKASGPYTRFTKAYRNKFRPVSIQDLPGTFQEYFEYGYENKNSKVMMLNHITDSITELTYSDYYLVLAPWHDGVQVLKIIVPNSGKGIGTKVMNDLYDISEELSIPIYLTPYPAEDFIDVNGKEKKLVKRLEKWYRKLGFDVSTESRDGTWSPKMWSNME
jgi:hypothetical protein